MLLVAAVLAAACSGSGSGSASRESENRNTAEAATTGEIAWGTCQSSLATLAGLKCGTLEVPLDHDDPEAGTITMTVARRASTGDAEQRIGSLVLNPGGPGGSGIEYLAGAATTFPPELTNHFDLVSFDPRGVGESTPLSCLSDEQRQEQMDTSLDPTDPNASDVAIAQQQELRKGCEEAAEDLPGDLVRHMSTADVAMDMDLLREALGDEELTYMGFSYGTSIGATYATLFPEHTRALVLDGPTSPGATREERTLTQAEGFATVYDSFIAECDATPDCPLAPDAAGAVDVARQQLRAEPLTVTTPAGERILTADVFDLGLATGLYDTTVWHPMASAIAQLDDGGAQVLLTLADRQTGRKPDGTFDNSADARAAVNCADDPERLGASEALAAADRIAAAAPEFGRALSWAMLSCLDWPTPQNPTPEPSGEGAAPILVVGTLGDPATPYAWAEEMAGELESAVLLTYEGDGHTAFLRGGDCVTDAVVDFLVSLTEPSPGTSCGAVGKGEGLVPLADTVVDQFTESGIPSTVAECVVDGIIDEVGPTEFDRLVLSNDPGELTGLMTAQVLGCAATG